MLEVDSLSKTLGANFTITLLPWEWEGRIFLQKGIFCAGVQLRVKAASKIPVGEACVKLHLKMEKKSGRGYELPAAVK